MIDFSKNVFTLKKSIDDALWNDINDISEVGSVSVKAIETNQSTLTNKQCYELSIAVNACVNAICRNISKAKVRLFRAEDGKEIVGGRLFNLLKNPAPRMTTRRFIWEIASWYNISGELAVYLEKGDDGRPASMCPLDPFRLHVHQPMDPNGLDEVRQWRYDWQYGPNEYIRADWLLFERMFNPNSPIRGLSPLTTGAVEIGTGYSIGRYNKGFFDNGGIPSHILKLPDGTSNATRKDIERRYREEFSSHRGNSHKVMVVAGKDADIKLLDQGFQDGSFMELRKSILQQTAMLYRVPAIEAGIYDKTRFDTAAEERKLFVESTLIPQMDVFSECLQSQLVDPYFSFDNTAVVERKPRSKAMEESLEEAVSLRRGSRIIVMIDPDTLPIMGAVKASQIAVAKDFKDTLMMSAKETADYFAIDIEDRKERQDVWIDRRYVNVTQPEMNQKFMPQPRDAAKPQDKKGDSKPAEKTETKALTAAEKKAIKSLDKSFREIRRLTLDYLDDDQLFSIEKADELTDKSDAAKRAVRIIRHELKAVLNADDPKRAAKDYFNSLSGARFV
ncbi:MAG: phage portal protein [Desulfurellales bacterium]|nr:MAG: phage portal protein [Desulfurellales bacterium]